MSTETLSQPATPQPEHVHVHEGREEALRALLGTDYEYAHKAGLVGMFYYNEETGEDALIHTLAGNYAPGTTIPNGFHHGPSGEVLWPAVVNSEGEAEPVTRKIPEEGQQTYPMEPSHSGVVIGGLTKTMMQRRGEGQEPIISVGKFGMFPDEYDALAVLQTIRIARENPTKPIPPEDGRPSYVIEGEAPLIDGKNKMTVRMAIDRQTGKIKSAYPKTRKGKHIMGLTEEQMWDHIMTPTPKDENSI